MNLDRRIQALERLAAIPVLPAGLVLEEGQDVALALAPYRAAGLDPFVVILPREP